MAQAVPSQHPAVVPRSRFNQLRALLAVTVIAVIGLTATVVILAGKEDQATGASAARPIGHINYGGFNPATARPDSAAPPRQGQPLQTGSRNDGAPDDGVRSPLQTGSRNDGAPEEDLRGPGFSTD